MANPEIDDSLQVLALGILDAQDGTARLHGAQASLSPSSFKSSNLTETSSMHCRSVASLTVTIRFSPKNGLTTSSPSERSALHACDPE